MAPQDAYGTVDLDREANVSPGVSPLARRVGVVVIAAVMAVGFVAMSGYTNLLGNGSAVSVVQTADTAVVLNCISDPAELENVLSSLSGDGDHEILLEKNSQCSISSSSNFVVDSVNNIGLKCWDSTSNDYCTGDDRAVIEGFSAADSSMTFTLTFKSCFDFEATGIHFKTINLKHQTSGGKTVRGTTYDNCVFEKSPAQSLNFYFYQSTTSRQAFQDITITDCTFFDMGFAGITIISWPTDGDLDENVEAYDYTTNVVLKNNVMYNAWTAATDAAGTTPEKAPGVILNRVRGVTAQYNSFVRMAGSGLWSTQTYDLNFSHNFVAWSRRVTDSTTNHVDIQNDDSLFEYNIGYKNEGGFFESMGRSDNIVTRYCVSINDGQEELGDGERNHIANTIFFTGYAGPKDTDTGITPTPVAPTNMAIYNNLIVSTTNNEGQPADQLYVFLNQPENMYFVNNEFVLSNGGHIDQHCEEGSDYHRSEFHAQSNLIGADRASFNTFNDMFSSTDNARFDEQEATVYAEQYADVVHNYLLANEPDLSTLKYDDLRTALCALGVTRYGNAMNADGGAELLTTATQFMDTAFQYQVDALDFCGNSGTTPFIGAIRPTESDTIGTIEAYSPSPSLSQSPSPSPSPSSCVSLGCQGWCSNMPATQVCSLGACLGCADLGCDCVGTVA